jgi:chromosome segregation ATPase
MRGISREHSKIEKEEDRMALTEQDIQAIAQLIQPVKNDMQDMKVDMQNMKVDMQNVKDDIKNVKNDMQNVKNDIQMLSNRTTNIELTLENKTNHNIQLLAENHLNLVDKLNEAIKVQDKSILFEVHVSGLRSRVELLEKDVAEIKSRIA